MNPVIVMASCFKDLAKPKLANLISHEAAGTPICCGPTATLLTDGAGGGCPAVLACEPVIPMVVIDCRPDWDAAIKQDKRAKQWLSCWISLLSKDLAFTEALSVASPENIRQAIRVAAVLTGLGPNGSGFIFHYTNDAGESVNLITMQHEGRLRVFHEAIETT